MSDEDIRVLRAAWKALEPDMPRFVDALYEEFFSLEPQLRLLFEVAMDEQHQKLASFIGAVVGGLERPEDLGRKLRDLGERHAGYGVRRHHFDSMGTAWMQALERVQGDRLSGATRNAWQRFYSLIAEGMQQGMGLPTEPMPVD